MQNTNARSETKNTRFITAAAMALVMVFIAGCDSLVANDSNSANVKSAPQQPSLYNLYYGTKHLATDRYGNQNWRETSVFYGTVGLPFGNLQLHADVIGGSGSWNSTSIFVATGRLPPGLELDSNNGAISGVPTLAGDYSFTIQASGIQYSGYNFGNQTAILRMVINGN
jgi:hypothetical protein